jgi:excinuclease ABC subunit C
MVESLLDDVPGLGEVRRKALISRFGSLRKIRAASVEEIAQVPGIGQRTAEAIVGALSPQGEDKRPSVTINTATGEIIEES